MPVFNDWKVDTTILYAMQIFGENFKFIEIVGSEI